MEVEEILKKMEEMIGEKPVPQLLMSKVVPEWIPRQMDESQFVILPNPGECRLYRGIGSETCTGPLTKLEFGVCGCSIIEMIET